MKIFERSLDFNGSNGFFIKSILITVFLCLNLVQFITSNFISSDKPKPKPNMQKSKFVNFDAIRSYVDKKKYYKYTLPSKLQVLIIKDSSTRASGAAVTVNSGINKEPSEIYGLAHFCEHMLFLGSKKYPKPTHFVDFITLYGGKFNGYTDFENTGFFFKILTDKFPEALDIFSRFFIDPLFSSEYVEKEVNSVNSEFERNIQLDSKRKEMVLREIANPDSLFHRFSTGNRHTLSEYAKKNNIDLREKVYDFYKKNYRPDNMQLIIYGNKDIEFYKDLVEKNFKDLKAPEGKLEEAKYQKLPWEYQKLGILVLYQTINNHQEIDISFMVEDIFKSLPDNSALYYKILLNYRGTGSLDDVLRKHGYVAGIKAYLRKTHNGFSLFKIRGYATSRGITNLDRVITIIYKYLKFIRVRALDKSLYDYTKKVFDIAFYYNNKKKKITKYLKMFCGVVWKYQDKFWLSQHKIMDEFNEQKIKKFGKYLTLSNSIIMIGNKSFEGLTKKYNEFVEDFNDDEEFKRSDPFYKTKFLEKNIRKEFINLIDSANAKSELKGKKMKLFANKKTLPSKISLTKECKGKKKKCVKKLKKDGKDLEVSKIQINDIGELWHKLDRSFLIAKTNMFIKFNFEHDVNDIKYATQLRLLIYAINHNLRNFFFEESLRQSSFNINASPNGFSIKVFSFTETISKTVLEFLSKLRNLDIMHKEFELIKDEMKNQIKAQMNLVPALRAYVNFFTIILRDFVNYDSIVETLDKLKLNEFKKFYASLFDKVYMKMLIHGTLDLDDSTKLSQDVAKMFSKSKSLTPKGKDYMNQHADLSGYFIFREHLNKSYNINHAILNFYQIGQENIANIVCANMVKALSGYIYFTELRIKEQLGYTAKGKIFSEGNVIYYMIMVQGSTKTPDFMDLRIENLLTLMRKRIETADEKKFEKFKNAIARKIGKKDKNIKKRTFRLWNEIIMKRYYFNMKPLALEYINKLKLSDVLDFFDKMVTKDLKKLSVQEFSKNVEELPTITPKINSYQSVLIKDTNELRKREKFITLK